MIASRQKRCRPEHTPRPRRVCATRPPNGSNLNRPDHLLFIALYVFLLFTCSSFILFFTIYVIFIFILYFFVLYFFAYFAGRVLQVRRSVVGFIL
jgi:hypothetical protein